MSNERVLTPPVNKISKQELLNCIIVDAIAIYENLCYDNTTCFAEELGGVKGDAYKIGGGNCYQLNVALKQLLNMHGIKSTIAPMYLSWLPGAVGPNHFTVVVAWENNFFPDDKGWLFVDAAKNLPFPMIVNERHYYKESYFESQLKDTCIQVTKTVFNKNTKQSEERPPCNIYLTAEDVMIKPVFELLTPTNIQLFKITRRLANGISPFSLVINWRKKEMVMNTRAKDALKLSALEQHWEEIRKGLGIKDDLHWAGLQQRLLKIRDLEVI